MPFLVKKMPLLLTKTLLLIGSDTKPQMGSSSSTAALPTTAEFITNKWCSFFILDETCSNAIAFNDLETLVAVLRHGAKTGHRKSKSLIARCVRLAIDHRNIDFLLRLAHSVSPIHVAQWAEIASFAYIGRHDDDDRRFEQRIYLLNKAMENGVAMNSISPCPRMTSHFPTGSSVVDHGIAQAFDHIDLEGLLGLIPNHALHCILSNKFASAHRQPANEQILLDMAIEISRVKPETFLLNAESVDMANIDYLLTTISQGNYPDMNKGSNLTHSGRYLLGHLVPLLVEMAIHETPLMQDLWRCVSEYCGPCSEDAQKTEWFQQLFLPINSSKKIKHVMESCDQEMGQPKKHRKL